MCETTELGFRVGTVYMYRYRPVHIYMYMYM